MKRTEFLQTVRKEIHYIFARNAIEKELEQHINESIEDMIADGMPFDEAEELADAGTTYEGIMILIRKLDN